MSPADRRAYNALRHSWCWHSAIDELLPGLKISAVGRAHGSFGCRLQEDDLSIDASAMKIELEVQARLFGEALLRVAEGGESHELADSAVVFDEKQHDVVSKRSSVAPGRSRTA